jgi:hypothetical protein
MNFRRILGCTAFCVFIVILANAQYSSSSQISNPKSILFKQIPQKSRCNIKALDKLFSSYGHINSSIAQGFFLRGELTLNLQRNPAVKSIMISLSDFPGAYCTLSRIHLPDGSIQYSGHIISPDDAETVVLSLENGYYYFTKTEQRLVITD